MDSFRELMKKDNEILLPEVLPKVRSFIKSGQQLTKNKTEGIGFIIGDFTCSNCGEHHTIHCKTKKDNPTMLTKTKHWIE